MDDSTISQPHLKNTIICVSLAVFYHISNRKNRGKERLMEIFEERLHPITVSLFNILRLSPVEFTVHFNEDPAQLSHGPITQELVDNL